MEQEQGNRQDDTVEQNPEVYYGTVRRQQMSGGTTSGQEDATADEGMYGATRIAQMHGVGDETPSGDVSNNEIE